jgi:hypothetical protein
MLNAEDAIFHLMFGGTWLEELKVGYMDVLQV